ncbi:hypothetical protein AAZV13_06G000450 [Glycine max]
MLLIVFDFEELASVPQFRYDPTLVSSQHPSTNSSSMKSVSGPRISEKLPYEPYAFCTNPPYSILPRSLYTTSSLKSVKNVKLKANLLFVRNKHADDTQTRGNGDQVQGLHLTKFEALTSWS